ncbi:MAG TPA: GH1 family beta-glucosidase [Candidatus Eisenbacteria bacterium]|nr:GH1 family beta-glucosidase [Candidatus Eisenbacteria bacterium]
MTVEFPEDFVWGASTSAYQIEGATGADGRGPSIWDTFVRVRGAIYHGENADIACDHYNRLEADLDLIALLGLKAYRFSIAWPRVQPDGRSANPAGLGFYDRLVDGLLARNVMPIATLYHWDLPQALQDRGGWTNRATADCFADYASIVVRRLGDRVERWITINEPWVAAFVGHLEGRHAPGIRDEAKAVTAAHHLLLAHARGLERIRDAAPRAKAGISLNLSDVLPASGTAADVAAAAKVDMFENRLFLSPLFRGAYPQDAYEFWSGVTDFSFVRDGDLATISRPMDFLGVNFYEQHRVVADARHLDDPSNLVRGTRKLPPEPPITAGAVAIRPDALYSVLTRLHREWTQHLPIWITESGIALHDYIGPDGSCHDPERIDYYDAYFRAAAQAIDEGVPLQGYMLWSLMDNFEWAAGYRLRFGLVYLDYATQSRVPKSSAEWFGRVIAANAVPSREVDLVSEVQFDQGMSSDRRVLGSAHQTEQTDAAT